MPFFKYGEAETSYLKSKDPKLAAIIDRLGYIPRQTDPDLFKSLASSIISQQISGKAATSVWNKIVAYYGAVTPENIITQDTLALKACGTSLRKAEYIHGAAFAIIKGELSLEDLPSMSDSAVCENLTKLRGVGTWTAEMLMIFSMRRNDILSYVDFGILRGLRMVHNIPKIEKNNSTSFTHCTRLMPRLPVFTFGQLRAVPAQS